MNSSMKIQSIKQERLYLRVADQLAEKVRNGEIKEGERLPSERDLATLFGVSRPTIREAMIALEIANLVEIRSGSGVYVKTPDLSGTAIPHDAPGPLELIEARYFIEGEAAALAAQRANDTDLALIAGALDDMAAKNEASDAHEDADEAFHTLIAMATKNSAMIAMIERLWEWRTTTAMSMFFHEQQRQSGVQPSVEDHRQIYEAIRRRDADSARSAMHSHLGRVLAQIVDTDPGSGGVE
ncbi:MAG: FadR/GntR family transcriptional regulator [Halieaceae bacterium]|nr:FadR/GntR family transcriptional regulator [Halieaceae bacterium]